MRYAILIILLVLTPTLRAADNWPQFRGPTQQGHVNAGNLPTQWSESQNITWKTPIPGEGWSSPVIWGNQVWMTTATDGGKSLRAVCVDKTSGKIEHNVEVFSVAKPDSKNAFNSYASPTPVIEEGRVYVCFGNYGSACLDTATGKPIWTNRDLKLDHKEGPGSSPILYKHLYILNCDGMDVQYVAALNKSDGKLAWKTKRSFDFGDMDPDVRKAYSTPLVINVNGQDQLISIGAFRTYAYDPLTGRELWFANHTIDPAYSNVAMPVFGHDLLFISTGFNYAEMYAVKPTGAGDVTSNIVWEATRGICVKPSPLLVGDRLYFTTDQGIGRCLDAKTGKQVWQKRVGNAYSASPIYNRASNLIYFFSEKGSTAVVKPGDDLQVVHENHLDGRILASPAVSDEALFLRTHTHVYRIEQ